MGRAAQINHAEKRTSYTARAVCSFGTPDEQQLLQDFDFDYGSSASYLDIKSYRAKSQKDTVPYRLNRIH
jgi:hypothetical protein